MGSTIVIHGIGPLSGGTPLVGDKSVSHRALLLGALCDGPTRVRNLSPCGDVARTLACLEQLGIAIDRASAREVVVHGKGIAGLAGPPVELDCGDSGTTMRLLAGLLSGQDRAFVLDGSPALRRRPMERVVGPLRAMGATIGAADGCPPLHGHGGNLTGADITLDKASAQVGSAVLLAGLNAVGPTTVRYPQPVRDHTARLLAALGAPVRWDGTASQLAGSVSTLAAPDDGLTVPDDISAAAFLLTAAAVVPGSTVRLPAVGVNPGRTGIIDILAQMGARLSTTDWSTRGSEPVATLTLSQAPLVAIAVNRTVVARTIDELPLIAVLGSQATGRTVVSDAAELRVKESDRIAAIVDGLSRLGARIEARPDGFVVEGPTPLSGATVDGRGDHRIVMALAVAGLAASGETVVTGAERIADSFPGFVGAMTALGGKVAVVRPQTGEGCST